MRVLPGAFELQEKIDGIHCFVRHSGHSMKHLFPIVGGMLTLYFSAAAGDWPQWLGPTRDAHAADDEKPPASLPSELKTVWSKKIGGGFSSPVVARGRVAYFDEVGENEVLHLIDVRTGQEIWNVTIATKFQDEWGAGPRSTPFFDADRLYCQSSIGEFRCVNVADGKTVWGASFEKDFGVKFLGSKVNEGTATRRGNNGSGIMDGNAVIVPVGNTAGASIVCFDKLTGKVLWKSGDDEAAYSSLQVATLAGTRQVVAFTAEALCAFDRATGKPLWRVVLKTNAKRHAMTPVIFGDQVVVNSHTLGMICYKISREGGEFKASQAWINKTAKTNLSTPVLVDGHLYCQGAGTDFICVNAASGDLKWTHENFSRDTKKMSSSVLAIGNKILALNYEGLLYLIEADPAKYTEVSHVQVCGSNWNFPACANGKLFVRDNRELICYDLLP